MEQLVKGFDTEVGRALSDADVFADFDLESIAKRIASPGLSWRLNELNKSTGPLRRGDFIIVGARPETGKTTFMASETSYFAELLTKAGDGRPIVWINNEEQYSKVAFRIMQASLGLTSEVLMSDLKRYQAEFEALCGKRRFIIPQNDAGFNTRHRVERLLKDTQPAAVVFDQLDKVHGFSGSDDVAILAGKYQWGRDMAHEYGPVFAISQASASDSGSEWIYSDQLRGSKTDKPGEADVILTIGAVKDPNKMYERYIHFPKNKLFGPLDEKVRHGYWTVDIEPMYARYKGKL